MPQSRSKLLRSDRSSISQARAMNPSNCSAAEKTGGVRSSYPFTCAPPYGSFRIANVVNATLAISLNFLSPSGPVRSSEDFLGRVRAEPLEEALRDLAGAHGDQAERPGVPEPVGGLAEPVQIEQRGPVADHHRHPVVALDRDDAA